jgi:two-component system heavy metal sensor histidine kinase CusS
MYLMSATSITQRLTALFVISSSAILLVLGLVIASSVEKHFEEQDMALLTGKMLLAQNTISQMASLDDLAPITHMMEHTLVGLHGLEVLVLNRQLQVIFATPNAGFPVALIQASAVKGPKFPAVWSVNGLNYRGIAAELKTGMPDGTKVTVAMAADIAQHRSFMHAFRQTLWFFMAVAAALSGLLGWFVANRGLAPLRAMRDQTKAVTANQLSYRLPLDTVPTELAELAQSLNEMLSRLESAFTQLSDFSSDIAHELRTPVSNLMTQTQVALSHARDADVYRKVLESNSEEYERMSRMISDMLMLAKAENGLMAPSTEIFDVVQECRALFDYYEAVADEKEVTFSMQGEGTVVADRLMLRRALGNLLSNAIRHANRRTSVVVAVVINSAVVEIHVKNTGDVIPSANLERVFERFFRVDPSRQRSTEGTGLGLAIAKSIVVAHGGAITAISSNAETSFTIRLPHRMP